MCPGVGPLRQTKNRELGRQPGTGHEREKGEGLSTVEAGRCPRPGAVEEAEPPGEAGEGPGPCSAHPPTRLWQRLAVCKPGAVQGAGLSPSSDQTLTSLSPLTPNRKAPLIPQLCQALTSFTSWTSGGTNPVPLLPFPHSLLLPSRGSPILTLSKQTKKKSLPRTKHCAGHSSGPVAMPSHPSPWASPLPFHVPRPSRAPCPKAYESLLCAPQPLGYSHWSRLQAGR